LLARPDEWLPGVSVPSHKDLASHLKNRIRLAWISPSVFYYFFHPSFAAGNYPNYAITYFKTMTDQQQSQFGAKAQK